MNLCFVSVILISESETQSVFSAEWSCAVFLCSSPTHLKDLLFGFYLCGLVRQQLCSVGRVSELELTFAVLQLRSLLDSQSFEPRV